SRRTLTLQHCAHDQIFRSCLPTLLRRTLRNDSASSPCSFVGSGLPCRKCHRVPERPLTPQSPKPSSPSRYIVRHGAMRHLGEFTADGAPYSRGQLVVVRTERGAEAGEVLCPSTPQAVAMIAEATSGQIV